MDKHRRLREARKKAQLTQPKLAALVGLAQAQISRMESGEMWTSNETVAKIAAELGIPVADLLDLPGLEKSATAEPPAMDSPAAIKKNRRLPDGLRKFAGDKQMVSSLNVNADEWTALASLQLPTPVDKSGYITLLATIRSVTQT